MAHYIDADHLRAEIKNLEEEARKIRVAKESTMNERIGADGQVKICQKLQLLIDQLQQEQPEVDLWKEIHVYFNPYGMELQFDRSRGNTILKPEQLFDFARHFYELGCRHTAVMYDDIEFERQRAEEAEITKGLEEYCPYKTTVESILKMFDSYSITTDKSDFIDNIRVKCKDAVEYNKLFPKRHRETEQPASEEQMEVDLEKEIARFALNGGTGDNTPTIGETARHFAEWGASHAVAPHYFELRELKTGRVFLAEWSDIAGEWYERGNGKAYQSDEVEIVQHAKK